MPRLSAAQHKQAAKEIYDLLCRHRAKNGKQMAVALPNNDEDVALAVMILCQEHPEVRSYGTAESICVGFAKPMNAMSPGLTKAMEAAELLGQDVIDAARMRAVYGNERDLERPGQTPSVTAEAPSVPENAPAPVQTPAPMPTILGPDGLPLKKD